MSDIGLCQCGCGQKTRLAPQNHTKWGWVKGESLKFCKGHYSPGQGKESPAWKGGRSPRNDGYILIHRPDHPKADSRGYVLEHILIAEKAFGKSLPQKAVIHHHTPEQLVVCQNRAYHNLLHRRQRAFEVCGHANWRKCGYCLKYDEPGKLVIYGHGGARHKECQRLYKKGKRALRVQENMVSAHV